ncbi:MAG: hypothetical protein A2Y33_08990 [Spirochaetes bacterium GWF1_51_8]|nr:MAG: hypothetical protein A2Y33_08990 [Spirochaetes bacterium GWF1_51_8]
MVFSVYIHYTCPHSRELLALIREAGFSDAVNIIDAGDSPLTALSHGVLSVPALFAGDRPIISGVFDPEWLKNYFKLYTPVVPDDETLFRGMIQAASDNAGTAIQIYLYEDPAALFGNPAYLLSASGLDQIAVPSEEKFLDRLREVFTARFPGFFAGKPHLFMKAAAMNFLREVWWLEGREVPAGELEQMYPQPAFTHWLFTRAAVGRIGLRTGNAETLHRKGSLLREYLFQNLAEFWPNAVRTASL